MAHWHDFNPWAERVIYVPDLDEFLDCLEDADTAKEYYIEAVARMKYKVDCYILPQPNGSRHYMGIRFGSEGNEYLSPYGNTARLQRLIDKYGPKAPEGVQS